MKRFFHKQSGLTIIEYAIAGALIVSGAAVAFNDLGDAIINSIEEITDILNPTPGTDGGGTGGGGSRG